MSWQAAIPITIALTGLFHYLLAQVLLESKNGEDYAVMAYSWLGFAFLFMVNSLFCIHLYASNPIVSTDLSTATRVAYLMGITSFSWSVLYFVIKGFQHGAEMVRTSGRWWRR